MTWLLYALLILGVYLACINWLTLWVNIVRKKHVSFAPFIGGIFLCIGILAIPYPVIHKYAWLAFWIDFGSLPWLIMTLYYFIKDFIKAYIKKL